ncbi:MAG: hypothetical protein S0880_09810 [Actinomycetota bacterium]|nr:hypothetical protein [Actinomycetota bacterium]
MTEPGGHAAPIALVTAVSARSLDVDLPPLVEALDELGIEGEPVAWDDPAVDWDRFRLAVIRSTWDYARDPAGFLAWLTDAADATEVLNPPAMVRWNLDKRYLAELATDGVAAVPTVFVDDRAQLTFPPVDFVVKPAISAGSIDSARYTPSEEAAATAHAERLLAQQRVVMVQPYVTGIDEGGETDLVYVDGTFSHALRKDAILGSEPVIVDGLYAAETITVVEPSAAQRALADATVAAVTERFTTPLYARVDLVPGGDGSPLVMEIELIEPSLFHQQAPGSATTLAEAIAARAAG